MSEAMQLQLTWQKVTLTLGSLVAHLEKPSHRVYHTIALSAEEIKGAHA